VRLRFDRGTILIEDPAQDVDPSALPGVLWDPRVRAFRAPAYRYRDLQDELERREVALEDGFWNRPAPIEAWNSIDLRPYQETALLSWGPARRRGVVALPTGSGKTRVALAIMARAGLPSLCLVPTRVLLDQWQRSLANVYPGRVGCFGDGSRDLAPVTVATFESAYRRMDVLGNRFDVLVVDEAHHFGLGIRGEALEMCAASFRLGLTATPSHNEVAVSRISELIGPTVYHLAVGDLAGRFLASFDLITLSLDLSKEEREAYERDSAIFKSAFKQFHRIAPGASWTDFVRATARTEEGRRALGAWRRARGLLSFTRAKAAVLNELLSRHRGSRVLVFTADNEAAYTVARENLVMPITCDIGREERVEALGRFERGELRALVSARVLNEGLDVPCADVAVIVGSAHGEREYVQRIGRLLRPADGKRALIYELVTRGTTDIHQAQRRRRGLAPREASQI